MIADVIHVSKTIKQTAFTKEERDYKKAFESELKIIKDKPPVDAKDEFAREEMLDYENFISFAEANLEDIMGEKSICERDVET